MIDGKVFRKSVKTKLTKLTKLLKLIVKIEILIKKKLEITQTNGQKFLNSSIRGDYNDLNRLSSIIDRKYINLNGKTNSNERLRLEEKKHWENT